jgi:CRISPR-associated exonuclease Cas4
MKYITAVDVKDYTLCPRIVYYTNVLHIRERVTEAMELGREMHDEESLKHLIPMLKVVKVLRDIEITSRKLKLTGRIDYIFITKFNEYIPADMKWSDPEHGIARKHHRAQLAAYSLLIEEAYKTVVKRAVIHYTRAGKTVTVPVTASLKNQVVEAIMKIYEMIKSGREPEVRMNKSRCENCNYQVYCKSKMVGRILKLEVI